MSRPAVSPPCPVAPMRSRSRWAAARRRLTANRAAVGSLWVLAAIAAVCVLGPLVHPLTIDQIDWTAILAAPEPASGHWFGTDANGRDLLVRTLVGGQISLLVGITATATSLVIGVVYGATAGYCGGRTDELMMRLVDVLYALPFLFFVILLMVLLGRNIVLIFVAIGAIEWLDMARIVRGQTLGLKRREFVEAARACGVGPAGIVLRHIIPNTLGPVTAYATLTVPKVILLESFISFLGLGVQEPLTSWGVLISEGTQVMEAAPWALLFPAGFLVVTLLALNFLGDGLRDALDPREPP